MKKRILALIFCGTVSVVSVQAQTEAAYETSSLGGANTSALLDPSRFSIHHGLNFGMSSDGSSGLKSQSLYTTMLQYRFHAPVTLNLNFGFPLHSTYDYGMNLNEETVTSTEYFRSMPLDFSLTWQPTQNMMMRVRVERNTTSTYQHRSMIPFMDDRIFHW